MDFTRLKKFIVAEMRMSHIYQPTYHEASSRGV
jgi:hypothetical protein